MLWSVVTLSAWFFTLAVAALMTAHQLTFMVVRRRNARVNRAIVEALRDIGCRHDDPCQLTEEEDAAIAEELEHQFPPNRPN